MPTPSPVRQAPAGNAAPAQIAALQRQLGERFKAWRKRAGLTQHDLGARTGYSRGAIRNAERGTSRSRDLFEAADTEVNAEGVLLAERDKADAAIKATRQDAARRARAALARQAGPLGDPNTAAPHAAAFLTLHCPSCDASLPATLGIQVALAASATDAPSPVTSQVIGPPGIEPN